MIQPIQPIDEQANGGGAASALPSPSTFNPTMRPLRPRAPKPVQQTPATPAMPAAPASSAAMPSTTPAAGATPGAANLPAPAAVAPPQPLTNPGGSVATTPIDPTNDLRSSAILPTSTPALDTARSGMIDASKAVTGYDRNADVTGLRDSLSHFFGPTDVQAGGGVGTAPSARLTNYNTMLDDSAGKLAGVDRVKLAQDMLAQFDDAQLSEHTLALNNITKQYVAKGGGRSGMVRTAYGNEDLTRQRDRDAMKKSLISAALEGTIQDQFNKTNALAGLQGATSAQDAAARGELRTDRGYATDVATGNVERGLSAKLAASAGANSAADSNRAAKTTGLAAASDLFNTLYGEGSAGRSEARGERAYQGAQEDQSYRRGMSELDMEQQQKTAELNRQLALLSAGEGGNPSGTLTNLANGQAGLDPSLIAALGSSLGKKANSGSTDLDAILAALSKSGALPGGASTMGRAVPAVAAGNEPAWEY